MLPQKIIDITNLIGQKRFYLYVNGIPIGFRWTQNYLIAFYRDPTLRGARDDHVTFKINFEKVKFENIHRTIKDGEITKRIYVDINYLSDPAGFKNLIIDLLNAEGHPFQKIVIALMYYLLRDSLREGRELSKIIIPTKEQAKQKGLKYPCLVTETGLMSKIVLSVMMKLSRRLNEKEFWRLRAHQIPGYKTEFHE